MIATRWHEDDLIGRLLREEADGWRVLSLPALAEEADPLGRPLGERFGRHATQPPRWKRRGG